MARRDEHVSETHPADDDLDRLRAGLLAPSDPAYARLRAHSETCAHCQARDRVWTRVREQLERGSRDPGLAARLRARRERALRGEGARTRPRAAAAFATFLVATLAIGLGTWAYLERHDGEARIAAGPGPDGVPDLYADIDFYLWLLEREAANRPPNG